MEKTTKKAHQRSDGRIVKTVTDKRTGKRIYFYGQTEREVNKKMLEYVSNNALGTKTFKQISDNWWEEAEPSLAHQSIKTYRPAKKRADEMFGSTPIKNIKPRDINMYLREMAKQGFAQKTVSNQRLVINLICNHAVLLNEIEYNPCSSVSIPKDLKKTTRKAASSSDEAIIKHASDKWLFPYIALMTGMRKGEILALQWKDIDFLENVIYVSKSVYHNGDRPLIKSPKTEAGTRVVPLLPQLKATLETIKNKKPNHYIISDTGEKPLTNRRFTTLMDNYKRETGVSCTAHQLRHSFATIAFEAGIPVKSVQEVLGHKQLSTTMDIYTEFRKSSLAAFSTMMEQPS
jgi:integrase